MNHITIKTSELKKSASNVRKGHSKEDIQMMANSIKARGIILPPLVARNGDGRFEIVAGQLRVAGAIVAGFAEIDCLDVSDTPDAERVALSLSENVVRRQMSAVELYRAFDKLFKAGASVEQIASQFSTTERRVHQLLAIGSLPSKILNLAEAEKIDDRALEALAIAPKADQRRYAKLPEKDRPRDWEIDKWLDGNDGRYREAAAIFDLELYTGSKITDLFAQDGDEVWLTDGAMFMELQNAALKAKLEDFKKKGWTCVEVDYWQAYAYNKTAKKKGGQVFWCRSDRTAAIEFHVGYARPKKAGAAPKPKAGKGEEVKKPATSKAFDDYCAALRHSAVCAQMIDAPKHGLVATVVLLLKQCDNISFRNAGGQVKGEAYCDSINEQNDNLLVQDSRISMYQSLGIKDGMVWDLDIAKITKKLLTFTPNELVKCIVTIVASSWDIEYSPKDGDALGKALGMNGVDDVELDDAFWNGITNKATLLAIAKEHKIVVSDKATVKVIRAKVKDGVPESWLPDFLTF